MEWDNSYANSIVKIRHNEELEHNNNALKIDYNKEVFAATTRSNILDGGIDIMLIDDMSDNSLAGSTIISDYDFSYKEFHPYNEDTTEPIFSKNVYYDEYNMQYIIGGNSSLVLDYSSLLSEVINGDLYPVTEEDSLQITPFISDIYYLLDIEGESTSVQSSFTIGDNLYTLVNEETVNIDYTEYNLDTNNFKLTITNNNSTEIYLKNLSLGIEIGESIVATKTLEDLIEEHGGILETIQVGDDVYAYICDDGTTYIAGTGDTYDYSSTGPLYQLCTSTNTINNITDVYVMDGVTDIGSYLLSSINLSSVTVASTVTTINQSAFYNCTSLESVTLSEGLETIGQAAFYNCTSLTEIIMPNTITTLGQAAFYNCTSLESVTLSEGLSGILETAVFNNCTSLTSITIPDSITIINTSAFYGCTSLAEVELGSGVGIINSGVFQNTTSLTSLTIPDNVYSILDYAFQESGIVNLVIGNGLTGINNATFAYCRNLETITIGTGVTVIGNYAFSSNYGITSLTSIIINQAEDSISGSPWGATNATVTWVG